jgi:uncharacterized membrane protein HdeD (DUF308 family)
MGVVYTIVGASFFFMPAAPSRDETFRWLTAYVSLGWFASLWIIAGVIAIVCAFRPRPKDAAGFIALVFAPGIWVGLFLAGAIITGSALATVSAIVYGAFGAVPLIVSGMQGPRDRDHREVK